jgi:hypothetical protein
MIPTGSPDEAPAMWASPPAIKQYTCTATQFIGCFVVRFSGCRPDG